MTTLYKLGMNAKLYFGAEAAAVGAMAVIANVKDVTISSDAGEADVTVRGNDGWRATAPTLKESSLEFEMIVRPSDAAYLALRNAFLNSTLVGMAALTGLVGVSGSEGIVGDYGVTSFPRAEPLEEAITASVTMKLARFDSYYSV